MYSTKVPEKSNDNEEIPYHARECAQPFTYGGLPKNFNKIDLMHVNVKEKQTISNEVGSLGPSILQKNQQEMLPIGSVIHEPTLLKDLKVQKMKHNQQDQSDFFQIELKKKEDKICEEEVPSDGIQKCVQPTSTILKQRETKRSATPSFPVHEKFDTDRCVSPYTTSANENLTLRSGTIFQFHQDPKELQEVELQFVGFVRNCSEYWYKPNISRQEAIACLRDSQPGTFLIRNSSNFPNCYGLVLRVSKRPQSISTRDDKDELVRHFLLEPTTSGIQLKGCSNEPTFTSLSAFVYQHSITALALPCTLVIPTQSFHDDVCAVKKKLLRQGAACNVLYLFKCNTESLTGDEAIRICMQELNSQPQKSPQIEVNFKVSEEGITITDNSRRNFFRHHFTSKQISYIGLDPDGHFWSIIANDNGLSRSVNKTIFGFIAKQLTGSRDNECHLFCDLAASQPASAIVSFTKKVIPRNNKLI